MLEPDDHIWLSAHSLVFSPGRYQEREATLKLMQRDWVLLGFVCALAAMILMAAISYRSIAGFAARAESVEHTYRVLLSLQDSLSYLRDAESGQRGFLLTGDTEHLAHYSSALESVTERVGQLRVSTADNPEQQRNLDRLEALLEQKARSLDLGIDLARDAADTDSVAAWLRAGEGRRQMDEIRTLTAAMVHHESVLLARRAAESGASARGAIGVVFFGSLVSIVLLLIVFYHLRREIRRRTEVEEALRRNRDEIEDLYNHAPCGYHSLDENGVFVRINDTELSWLGYTRDEVLGRMKFVDLLAPDSVQTFVENFPLFKATGAISNVDFTLRRKDDSELLVSLSATAVRDTDNNYFMSRSTMFDITERKRAEQRIAELNRDLERHATELEHVNHELESFSYSVSHDLRSPLRAIDGFSRMLEEDHAPQLDAEARRLLAVVRDNSRSMSRLIDDLLAFSRLGRKPIAVAEVDMKALADQALQEVLPVDAPSCPGVVANAMPPGWGDPVLLKQVWTNLLSNAVKFSRQRQEPEIVIGGTTDGDQNIYHVRDNGTGFDMRYYDKLFGVFQRLHRQEEFEGTGVGLAIVHRVITRHGGRVWAESELDRGATFFFSLPNRERAS
jgi:PAS domain S-box-containing protein